MIGPPPEPPVPLPALPPLPPLPLLPPCPPLEVPPLPPLESLITGPHAVTKMPSRTREKRLTAIPPVQSEDSAGNHTKFRRNPPTVDTRKRAMLSQQENLSERSPALEVASVLRCRGPMR